MWCRHHHVEGKNNSYKYIIWLIQMQYIINSIIILNHIVNFNNYFPYDKNDVTHIHFLITLFNSGVFKFNKYWCKRQHNQILDKQMRRLLFNSPIKRSLLKLRQYFLFFNFNLNESWKDCKIKVRYNGSRMRRIESRM